ncbi:cysteine and histidine-rich domain-containing protein 1-like isoform X2 [Xenia sp. Carnegie-2017]|uniref:cysteine and histidine-rich domain-containing protein 1-like isoform X2 n=1 Tax=Xenia sp. Carnegie-2017 TaxID=2897299 RepID=UPI001F03C12B|nr:cysteine and histidine-rich domain-containing protein 1-like isoform X2 [Xenia sp. Carnegie-2017]
MSNACLHHTGVPVFHDALKGWSCCSRRVTDFTEFLNMAGCTKSRHSNIKPIDPEVKLSPVKVSPKCSTTTHRKAQPQESEPRPRDDLPFQRVKYKITDSLKKLLEKQDEEIVENEENLEPGVIKIGTVCKNNGCNSVYTSEKSNSEICIYHPGVPVFHEGYKFWSCCLRKTSDFDEFLKQEGCTTGSHLWFQTDEQKKKAVNCRFDHYQMGGFVVITVYAKLCNPKKSLVETNLTGLKASLVFGGSSTFNIDIKLHGVIDPEKSLVTFSPTKVEIKLKKKHASKWPSLELKSDQKKSS